MASRAAKKSTRPAAKDSAGEQVFTEKIDDVLAQRIVHRARQNAHANAAVSHDEAGGGSSEKVRARRRFRPLAVCAVLAGIVLVVAGLKLKAAFMRKR